MPLPWGCFFHQLPLCRSTTVLGCLVLWLRQNFDRHYLIRATWWPTQFYNLNNGGLLECILYLLDRVPSPFHNEHSTKYYLEEFPFKQPGGVWHRWVQDGWQFCTDVASVYLSCTSRLTILSQVFNHLNLHYLFHLNKTLEACPLLLVMWPCLRKRICIIIYFGQCSSTSSVQYFSCVRPCSYWWMFTCFKTWIHPALVQENNICYSRDIHTKLSYCARSPCGLRKMFCTFSST